MENSAESVERELYELEVSLWVTASRFDRDYMEAVLAPRFVEFGRSGARYDREQCLAVPRQQIDAVMPLRDFSVRMLGAAVALVTYVSEVHFDEVEVANRASVWRHCGEGWQLEFHQGTPVIRCDEG